VLVGQSPARGACPVRAMPLPERGGGGPVRRTGLLFAQRDTATIRPARLFNSAVLYKSRRNQHTEGH
jgi:hypothetical protein